MKPRYKTPTTPSVSFVFATALLTLLFCWEAVAQKPPAGAGLPIPSISIGSDGIKLNFPKGPMGPGMRPSGPTPTADPPPLQPSDETEMEVFRHALAAQATPAQVSAYLSLVKSTKIVVGKLEDLRTLLDEESARTQWPAKKAAFDESLEKARTLNKAFMQGFSEQQKGALKPVTSKLIRSDYRLAERAKALDAKIAERTTEKGDLIGSSHKIEEALADFREQQRVLGKEMYALPDSAAEQPIFTMPPATTSVTIGSQTIVVSTSGTISSIPATNLDHWVHLQMSSNLGGLQQSITQILQSQLAHSAPCGERVAIPRAIVGTSSPTTDVWVQLHFERWVCLGGTASKTPMEVMEADGTMAVKITPKAEKDGSLSILTQIETVEANGMLAEMLRSGPLGDAVVEKVKNSFVTALQNSLKLDAVLLKMGLDSAAIETAKFVRDSDGGTLAIALDGHLHLSGDQVTALNGQKSESLPTYESSPR
jgi:hypothetical protein